MATMIPNLITIMWNWCSLGLKSNCKWNFKISSGHTTEDFMSRLHRFCNATADICTHTHTRKCTHTHTLVNARIYTRTQLYTRTHTHTHTHTNAHMQSLPLIYMQARLSFLSLFLRIKPKSQSEFILQSTEASEFFDSMDFEGVAFWVETVIHSYHRLVFHGRRRSWITNSLSDVTYANKCAIDSYYFPRKKRSWITNLRSDVACANICDFRYFCTKNLTFHIRNTNGRNSLI